MSSPTEIKLHQKSRVLEIQYADGRSFRLPYLEPVGSYAVQPVFSDGHSTGIYSWEYLCELGQRQEALWSEYLAKLSAAGANRDG